MVWALDRYGQPIEPLLNTQQIDLVLGLGAVGGGKFTLPYENRYQKYLKRDQLFAIYRYRGGRPGELLSTVFTTGYKLTENSSEGGTYQQLSITFETPETLFKRRIVPYAVDDTRGEKYGVALDTAMYLAIYQNMGSGVEVGGPSPRGAEELRNLEYKGLTISPPNGRGPVIDTTFSYKTILRILEELHDQSMQLERPTFWGMRTIGLASFAAQIYSGLPGRNRTVYGQTPIIFSSTAGTLNRPQLSEDYGDTVSYVFVGGAGQLSGRIWMEFEDTNLINESEYGLAEGFLNSQSEYTDEMEDMARGLITSERGRSVVTATITGAEYGIEGWRVGDLVSLEYNQKIYTGLVKAALLKQTEDGALDISARIEAFVHVG